MLLKKYSFVWPLNPEGWLVALVLHDTAEELDVVLGLCLMLEEFPQKMFVTLVIWGA